MFLRVLIFLFLMIFFTSCDYFSFSKNKNLPVLDTIVDFSSVDTFPSFPVCDSIFEKQKKAACFRKTIHLKIGEELQKHQFTIQDTIEEIVYVDLVINARGEFILAAITSSPYIQTQLPTLDSVLKVSVLNLPKIFPANKRGIPVTTKYRLPIQISLKE